MQALLAARLYYYTPSDFVKLSKEQTSNIALKVALIAGAIFLLHVCDTVVSLKKIVIVCLLTGTANCVILKLEEIFGIKEIKVLRKLPKELNYASIKGDEFFAISRNL